MKSYKLASTTWNRQEVLTASKLLETGNLTMGKKVREFEISFSEFIGSKYAVMFNSGSSANLGIFAALKYSNSFKINEGDNVIVPAVSWSTTYYPINQMGYILNFVDINPNTLNLDVEEVEKRIDSKTRAIFAVNLLGNPSNLIELKKLANKYNLFLLEDNCESLGAEINQKKTGSFGLMGSHSFFFSHHICTMEGGMVTTNSRHLMETLVSIRAHGWTRELKTKNTIYPKLKNDWEDLYRFVLPGYNLRPLEISGAIGSIQLKKLPKFIEMRRKNAKCFIDLFKNSENYRIQKENGKSSWFGFAIILQNNLVGKRTQIIKFLTKHKIETRPIVSGNFTLNPVMSHLKFKKLPNMENSNTIHHEGFFVGNHHYDTRKQIKMFYDLLTQFERENLK